MDNKYLEKIASLKNLSKKINKPAPRIATIEVNRQRSLQEIGRKKRLGHSSISSHLKKEAAIGGLLGRAKTMGKGLLNKAKGALENARSTSNITRPRNTPGAPAPARVEKPATKTLSPVKNHTKIRGLSDKAKIGLGSGATGLAVGYAASKGSNLKEKKN